MAAHKKGLTYHEPQLEETETIEIAKTRLKETLRLIDQGIITHAATIIALLKVATLKKAR